MSTEPGIIGLIADVFAQRGAVDYGGERVTTAQHMLQTAALAQAAGAPNTLVAAALLHDIGHFTSELASAGDKDMIDRRHEAAAAQMLAGHFPPQVVEPVRLHVAAKRYLCGVNMTYFDGLSPMSKRSLMLQGGAMDADAIAEFERLPFHVEAVQLRRWDDGAKRPEMAPLEFAAFRPLLLRLVAR